MSKGMTPEKLMHDLSVEFPDGTVLTVRTDAEDYDCDFRAKCLDTGETLNISGHLASEITILPEDDYGVHDDQS